jgi:hypothetical protein
MMPKEKINRMTVPLFGGYISKRELVRKAFEFEN